MYREHYIWLDFINEFLLLTRVHISDTQNFRTLMMPFLLQDKSSEHDLGSSSSRLITFDFSNGHSCSPLIPTTMDDQYMEYSFDGLADFPYNVEDEERVGCSKFHVSVPRCDCLILSVLVNSSISSSRFELPDD